MLGSQYAGNHSLTSLIGLSNLTSIGGSLRVSENIALADLAGLDNLASIGFQLEISFNDKLTSISGLLNVIMSIDTESIKTR